LAAPLITSLFKDNIEMTISMNSSLEDSKKKEEREERKGKRREERREEENVQTCFSLLPVRLPLPLLRCLALF